MLCRWVGFIEGLAASRRVYGSDHTYWLTVQDLDQLPTSMLVDE